MGFRSEFVWYFTIFDMFPNTQFLRYRNLPKYETFSAAMVSLCLLCVFFYLFTGMGVNTLNRKIITWVAEKENAFEPVASTVTFNSDTKNMFSSGIIGLDLNNPNERYFECDLGEKQ